MKRRDAREDAIIAEKAREREEKEKEIEELNMDLRSSVVEKEKGKRFEQII